MTKLVASSRALLVFGILIVGCVASPLISAQSLVSGDITGTVVDQSGAVISGAKVTLKSLDRGQTQGDTTNSSGSYHFSLLEPGRYSVTVEQASFSTEERHVSVAVGQTTATNFSLKVGATSTTIEVAGSTAVINVDDVSTSTTFNQRLVSTAPNPGGDLTNIAQLAPGVAMNTSGGFGYGNFTANGLPATANLFTINGENDMDPFFNINNSGATNLSLGLNEIQEATVITNPYSGQYGQQAGAQVNYITKSGTNAMHGGVKYLWNGSVLNANDWFANHQGSARPFANSNQWGGDVGGPILKDKLFYYANTEGLRFVLPTVQNTFIPSQPFANAVVANIQATQPASLPLYQKLMNVWTNPNTAGSQNAQPVSNSCGNLNLTGYNNTTPCVLNFSSTPTSHSSEWILSGRVDQNIGKNDKVFYRYRMDRGNQASYTDPVNSAFNATSNQPQYDGQANWTHIFTSGITNQFTGAGSWYSAKFLQGPQATSTFPDMIYFAAGSPLASTQNSLVQGSFGGQSIFPQGRNVTQYQFIDDLALVKGNHTITTGMNFRRYDVSDFTILYQSPLVIFTDMQSLATGSAFEFTQNITNERALPIALYGVGFYGQDDWKISPRLKLTLAMRFEHNSNPVCQSNCFSEYRTPFQAMQKGPDVPYNQNIQTGLHQAYRGTDAMNYSPRIGFTWSPRRGDGTVISGGFGLFYDALAQNIVESAFLNVPNVVGLNIFNQLWADPAGAPAIATTSAAAVQNGFANGATFNQLVAQTNGVFSAPGFTNYDRTMHTPQYQEWNLQLQQALGSNMALVLNYFGTHGVHVPISNGTLNAFQTFDAANGTGCTTAVTATSPNPTTIPCGAGFPFAPADPSYSSVNQWATEGISNSNGLTVSLNRRFAQDISFQANYTWSHGLDEVSNGGANPYSLFGSIVGQLNPASLRATNYGNTDYDIRNNFNANFVWQPSHKFVNPGVNGILTGWTFSGTFFVRSGYPYTIADGNSESNFQNLANPGPAFVLGQPLGPGAQFGQSSGCVNGNSQCFFPSLFVDSTAVAPGSTVAYSDYPTQVRNQYRGPGFFDMNFSFSRSIPIKEKVSLGFGANFYNFLNHPNFDVPNATLSSGDSTVGQVLSTIATPASPYGSFVGAAASARLIQLQATVKF